MQRTVQTAEPLVIIYIVGLLTSFRALNLGKRDREIRAFALTFLGEQTKDFMICCGLYLQTGHQDLLLPM